MMKSLAKLAPGELAAFIQSQLREEGIELVLTGGSVVSIYSHGKYVSKDLDFVVDGLTRRSKIRDAMAAMGFQEVGRHFEHPEITYLVEFPGGPLSVGKQQVGKIENIEFETGILKIISPTDCVKDRLAAYFFWNDQQCLSQAIMVSKDNMIDMDEVEAWADQEGFLEEFKLIKDQLK